MKKEILKEAAEDYCISNESIREDRASWSDIEESFIFGDEWQAERMYSEKDMIEFAKWVFLEVGSNTGKNRTNKELFKEWFEKFKKK